MGFGDDIMVTGEVKMLKTACPDTQILIGDGQKEYWSVIFDNNPLITRCEDLDPTAPFKWIRNYVGHRPYIDYNRTDPEMDFQQFFLPYQAKRGSLYIKEALLSKGQYLLMRELKRARVIKKLIKMLRITTMTRTKSVS